MKTECKITIEFKDSKKLKDVHKSVKVDNYNYVKSQIIDNKLIAKIETESISSLLHTMDDYLACVNTASKVVDKN